MDMNSLAVGVVSGVVYAVVKLTINTILTKHSDSKRKNAGCIETPTGLDAADHTWHVAALDSDGATVVFWSCTERTRARAIFESLTESHRRRILIRSGATSTIYGERVEWVEYSHAGVPYIGDAVIRSELKRRLGTQPVECHTKQPSLVRAGRPVQRQPQAMKSKGRRGREAAADPKSSKGHRANDKRRKTILSEDTK
eukprot:5753444-Prymnesium_polylepis.1